MKPTWKLLADPEKDSSNCKCLTCGKEFIFLGEGHFNMRLVTCPACRQQVWIPRCPNGCPSFDNSDSSGHLGNSIQLKKEIEQHESN